MEILIYIIPILLIIIIVLTVHEGGHLAIARFLGIRASGFQIGIGPKLFSYHTGANPVKVPPELPLPTPGERIYLPVNQKPDGSLAAVGWSKPVSLRQLWRVRKEPPPSPQPRRDLTLYGKVKRVCPETRVVVLADMTWSIGLIPVMAMVELPEANRPEVSACYNTTSWKNQMAIVLAGVATNILLLLIVIVALTFIPPPDIELLTVTRVAPQSQEYQAGLRADDAIIQAGQYPLPNIEELRQAQIQAFNDKHLLGLRTVNRQSGQEKTIRLDPGPGILQNTRLAMIRQNGNNNGSIETRFENLAKAYLGAIPQTAQELRSRQSGQNDGQPVLTGLPRTTYYTAKAVERGKLQVWLAILGAISLATAALNLIPFPPLDGYKLVIHSAEALLRRKFSPAAKFKLDFAGFAIIIGAGIYLAIRDILSMTY